MQREEFIERQAAFQFGVCEAPPLNLVEVAESEALHRRSLIYHDPTDGSFVPAERAARFQRDAESGWQLTAGEDVQRESDALRRIDALNDLYGFGLAAPVLLDMRDAVRRPNPFPVFQYNRQSGSNNAILFPLRRVHDIGTRSFCSAPDPSEPDFDQKKPVVCWRGGLRGFSSLGGKPVKFRPLVKSFLRGKLDRETLLAHLNTVPRYMFVSRYFDAPGFDIGFHAKSLGKWAQVPEIGRYAKDYVSAAEQAQCKYLVSIQGTDVGSSFGWQLGTNSVILRETYPWEVFFDAHFRPWDHYVPIAADFSDVPERVAWCEDNPQACRDMIAKRHEIVHLLLDEDARDQAFRRVVSRYNEFYRQWRQAA